MGHSEFRFKQFLIRQDRSAMKVCTDACLFGAWMAQKANAAKRILDIGSGTGLLMLMLAQKTKAAIDGIEIDPAAFEEATENILASPWSDRLHLYLADARDYVFRQPYDLIISNPPFYEGSLKASTSAKNLARHSDELKLSELIEVIERNLNEDGSFAVLLPYSRSEEFEEKAQAAGFYLLERMDVQQTPKHPFFRTMFMFSRQQSRDLHRSGIVIQDGNYTGEFISFLRDYYLYL